MYESMYDTSVRNLRMVSRSLVSSDSAAPVAKIGQVRNSCVSVYVCMHVCQLCM